MTDLKTQIGISGNYASLIRKKSQVQLRDLRPILWKMIRNLNLIAGECNGARHAHNVKDQSDSGDRNQFEIKLCIIAMGSEVDYIFLKWMK